MIRYIVVAILTALSLASLIYSKRLYREAHEWTEFSPERNSLLYRSGLCAMYGAIAGLMGMLVLLSP